MEKINKTNAMRALDSAKINYRVSTYEVDESDLSGVHAAQVLGIDPDQMFKTIVTQAGIREYRVFCIPVKEELDLKKCAVVSGDKRLELLHVKDLLPTTGYIRGGCSPIGMKKQYVTVVDETALLCDTITFSAGKIGAQVEMKPSDLEKVVPVTFQELTD